MAAAAAEPSIRLTSPFGPLASWPIRQGSACQGVGPIPWKRAQTSMAHPASKWWSEESDLVITSDIGATMHAHNRRRKHFNPLRDKVCPKATPH